MKTTFFSRWAPVLIAVPLLIGVLAGIYQKGFADLKKRPLEAASQAAAIVDQVSGTLSVTFQGLERSTRLFAQANLSTLEYLLLQPDNTEQLELLKKSLFSAFPEAYSVTVSTREGEPVIETELGLIGELCRKDIGNFTRPGFQREIFLHPVSGSPHIDVMVPLSLNRKDYVFFISFETKVVVDILASHQLPGHHLILVREDLGNLVEITAEGDRTRGLRANFITPREMQQVMARMHVPGTKWLLLDIPDQDLLDSFAFDSANPFLAVFFAVMVLGGVLVVYLQYLHSKAGRYAAELESSNSELSDASLHDVLTGLPNRRLFNEQLSQAIHEAGRSGSRLALLLFDLNHFKNINDTLGHQAGDMLLQVVGKRIKGLLREVDTVARLGGDEFVVLVRVDGQPQTELVAAKVLSTIGKAINLGSAVLNIDASLGVAVFPDHALTPEALLGCADQAMYRAKREGLRTAMFEPEEQRAFPDRLQLMAGLAEAIQNDQLCLWYQPKISTDDRDEVCHVEALVRWQHPVQGMIFPDDFLPLAEQASAIRRLTEWVIEKAVGSIVLFAQRGITLEVAVNLSVRVIEDSGIVSWISQLTRQQGIDPKQLVFEITESAEMVDSALCRDVLLQIQMAGFRLSVDDFGTGYASFSIIRELPVSELKIDRSFVTDCVLDRSNRDIVTTTIDLAHRFGFTVVAEGVEDIETVRLLTKLECDFLQGFALERPMPEDSLLSWCEARGQQLKHYA